MSYVLVDRVTTCLTSTDAYRFRLQFSFRHFSKKFRTGLFLLTITTRWHTLGVSNTF